MTNTLKPRKEKMTLKDYYQSLPRATYPKTDFLNVLIQRCNVSATTVRNWVIYGMKPSNKEHIKVLVETTGIKEDDLWV